MVNLDEDCEEKEYAEHTLKELLQEAVPLKAQLVGLAGRVEEAYEMTDMDIAKTACMDLILARIVSVVLLLQ